jgi:uncharacterized RDD family membrane protein YckC/predicted Ser/Thr protein kinase
VVRLELDETAPAPPTPERTATLGGAPAPLGSKQLATGKQLGHFKIERQLGAGGMGEVYLATDLALDRPVAVKVLPDAVSRDPKRRERMIREARAQARVAHPNVGHIYFIGEAEDHLYFAMEYVAGQTLAERIAKGPMPVDDALAVIRAAVLGLREAQRAGITHRDVKPSNLMIDGHGIVKVLDFGLAAGGLEAVERGPVAQTSLAGTPLYMAPEQARGEDVDFRSDIYALGATLYHLISGKPPFEADSVEELLSKHETAARPTVPRKGQRRVQVGVVDAILVKMMAAKPADRYASYEELLRALDLASDSESRPAGFWVRSVAMALDFAAVAVITGGIQLVLASFDLTVEDVPILFPALALMYAYALAKAGRTFGKTVMELEVVDVDTLKKPTLARAIRRSLMMFGLPILIELIEPFVPSEPSSAEGGGITIGGDLLGGLVVLWIVLCLINLMVASLRASGRRTLWDRVARSMVRYRTTRRSLADHS